LKLLESNKDIFKSDQNFKDFITYINVGDELSNELLFVAIHHLSSNKQNYNELNKALKAMGQSTIELLLADYCINSHLIIRQSMGTCSNFTKRVTINFCTALIAKFQLVNYVYFGSGITEKDRSNEALIHGILLQVIGAMCVIWGLDKLRNYLSSLSIKVKVPNLTGKTADSKDSKTLLQEHCQKIFKRVPSYNIIEVRGPDHNQIFKIGVTIDGRTATGDGKSKRMASSSAAVALLSKLGVKYKTGKVNEKEIYCCLNENRLSREYRKITGNHLNRLNRLAEMLNINPLSIELLEISLSHKSKKLVYQNEQFGSDNIKLAFLGSFVVNWIFTDLILQEYLSEASGRELEDVHDIIARLRKSSNIFRLAKSLPLSLYPWTGNGERAEIKSILVESFQASFATIYLEHSGSRWTDIIKSTTLQGIILSYVPPIINSKKTPQ